MCQFICDYISGVSCAFVSFFVPVKTGMNNQILSVLSVIILLTVLHNVLSGLAVHTLGHYKILQRNVEFTCLFNCVVTYAAHCISKK